MRVETPTTSEDGIFNGALDPTWAARSRVRRFKSVLFRALEDVETNRAKLIVLMLLVVDGVIVWPILLSLKIDGQISASWTATWTPLWIWDFIGLIFLSILASWGNLQAPDQMDKCWDDPFPLYRRVLELVLWVLLVLFQVFLTIRLDGEVSWSWSAVTAPLIGWAFVRLAMRLYTLHRVLPALGMEKFIYAAPLIAENCLVLAQLVLILLKVEGEVMWNWWWVFTPIWLGFMTQVSRSFWSEFFISILTPFGDQESELEKMEQAKAILSVQKKSLRSMSELILPLVTSVLLVGVLNGSLTSTFVIFIPVVVITVCGLFSVSLGCLASGGMYTRGQPSSNAVVVERPFREEAGESML